MSNHHLYTGVQPFFELSSESFWMMAQQFNIGMETDKHTYHWLSMVLRLHQHNIGYTADGFYRYDDPTNSVKALKEGG